MKKKPFYITTTLPYVNAEPHMGTALEFVLADITARYRESLGDTVFFNTGTDEHGAKIFKRAEEEGMGTQAYVDIYAQKFKKFISALNTIPYNFIRTTDEAHVEAAQEFWKRCMKKGYIDKRNQKITYCVGCELEKTDSELENKRCRIHPDMEVEVREEENYFFQMSKFQKKLLKLYESNTQFVLPDSRFNEVKRFVADGLHDFSISRLKEKMPWGVPVPEDDDHVMYVWFDALVTYISAIGWPHDMKKFKSYWPVIQIAGKDQLRPQIVMWQAMLMSVGIDSSKQIVIHGFITSSGQKMSKSLGNVIDPYRIIETYGADTLRYYLAREVGTFNDGDVTIKRCDEIYTSELAHGIGNTFSRILALTEQDSEYSFKKSSNGEIIKNDHFDFWNEYHTLMTEYQFDSALKCIQENLVRYLDKMISDRKPWEMFKHGKKEEAQKLIYIGLEGFRHIAHALTPFMPDTSEKIFTQLGLNQNVERTKSIAERETWGELKENTEVRKSEPLFPKK